jgi:putative acetyltransferase
MEGVIAVDDPRVDDVRALVATHLALAHGTSPPENVHALDVGGLLDPAITFYSYRVDGELLGIGALKQLDDSHAELKSMHTAAAARRQGVARALVVHLIAVARQRGYSRLSLETGTGPAFDPAHALYTGLGFAPSDAFGEYVNGPHNVCMTRLLEDEPVADVG